LWERSYDKFTADQRAHMRIEMRELDTMFYALRGMDFEANLP
jgi:hypothetical protein